jgi:glycerate-2-kinase
MKHDAIDIINSAIEAVDPYNAIRSFVHRQHNLLTIGRYSTNNVGKGDGMSKGIQQSSSSPPSSSSSTSAQPGLRTYDLSKDYDSVVLVAFGKASSAMATSFVQELLQINDEERASSSSSSDDISLSLSGVVICKDGHATPQELEILNSYAPGIKIMNASHPVPDDRSVDGATMLLDHVRMTSNPRCLVVCCISGGGSALFCSPRPPLTLGDLQIVNRVLLASGMSITEMNVIRKRLENGKGGRLATACYPSTVVTLVLSDVLGDPLDLIASGPTVPDTSTGNDAWRIVQEYNLVGKLPSSVESVLQQIVQEEEERMKASNIRPQHGSDHPVFETSQTVLVGNNPRAVEAAALKAKILGYHPVILGTEMDGEAKEIANFYVAMAKHLKLSSRNNNMKNAFSVAPGLPVALIAGGETTVTLHPDDNHNGKGGRNQELALSAAIQLETSNLRNVVIASAGTDGGDGPTDAAGAVVDACTIRGSRHDALVALGGHNAYPYLDRLGAELISDSTAKSQPPPPLIKTGPTGTNVADVCVTLIKDD